MFTTCHKCQKKNEYWGSRSLKEPIILNNKELNGCFTYSKYFCPVSERKLRDNSLPENQQKSLIIDCMNGNREEIREKAAKISLNS